MASPSELTLEYKPNTNTNTYSMIQNQPEQTEKLEDCLARLEEERLKIEAFKRELPLCMQLLNNAMEIYKRQIETNQSNQEPRPPVLEEFIPLAAGVEKSQANWMVSAQLWSPAGDHAAKMKESVPHGSSSFEMSTSLSLDTKQHNGSAFLPFSKDKGSAASRGLPELALASAEEMVEDKKEITMDGVKRESNSNGKSVGSEQGKGGGSSGEAAGGQTTHRKARRCWSPDLHRRFVNALQMLGGSQVATPKQIRELMKVDGLTNDEVKSHLQKYRLHTRRPIHPPQPPAAPAPQLVVLGGIWVPPEYSAAAAAAAAAAGATTAHYPIPHDFYASPVPAVAQHQLHRVAAAMPYRARVHSPESELRSGGDRSESIEEEVEDEEDAEEREEVRAEDKALVPAVEQCRTGNGSDVAIKL